MRVANATTSHHPIGGEPSTLRLSPGDVEMGVRRDKAALSKCSASRMARCRPISRGLTV